MFGWKNANNVSSNDDRFDGYDNQRIKITQNGKTVENIGGLGEDASIHGAVLIPNDTLKTLKWHIKFSKLSHPGSTAIGICSAQDKHYDTCYYCCNWSGSLRKPISRVSISYDEDGSIWSQGKETYTKTSGWNEGDIITRNDPRIVNIHKW